MTIFKMYLVGLGILVGAIVLNVVSRGLKIKGWYDFLQKPAQTNAVSYIWLFVVYPLCLGVLAYTLSRFLGFN